jgi:hypothetical protein
MSFQYMHNSQLALAIGLVNVVTGYVGADAVSETLIERVLWPQRANNGFGNNSIIKCALLQSTAVPLNRVALAAIDRFIKNSLHKGEGRGHLLGTAFFPDTGLSYLLHAGNGQPVQSEWVRNGLLVRILQTIPYIQPTPSGEESAAQRMRQRITVSHLQLVDVRNASGHTAIDLDDERISAKCILAIIASESPALIFAATVAMLWSIVPALIFLAPLALRLLAAATTMQREDLLITRDNDKSDLGAEQRFEIHVPGEGFQVISGPASLVLPFFRHYGHPIRCRWREVTQMWIVGLLGATFSLTFVATLLMPIRIQALFAMYQMYLLMSTLAARFLGGDVWGTTEERVGKALAAVENEGARGLVVLRNRAGEMFGVKLTRSVHGSYAEGKARVEGIVMG